MTIINRPKFEKPIVRRTYWHATLVNQKEREVLNSLFALTDLYTSQNDLPKICYLMVIDNHKVLCFYKKPKSLATPPAFYLRPPTYLSAKLPILINETIYSRN